MKKKTILAGVSSFALASVLAAGLFAGNVNSSRQAKAEVPSYRTYISVREGWIENTDGSAESSLDSLRRARTDRFWNGAESGWDSQERTFNCTTEFIDTIHRANGGEGWRGAYRTPELELYDNAHRYISFGFGGGGDDIFINIFQVNGTAGSGDRITGIRTALDTSGSLDDAGHLNAPISCNMVFKYFELPNEIQPGDKFLIYVRDGRTGGYGGFTFGDVHINQTLEECAKCFSAHKQQIKLNEYTSEYNRVANEYVLNYYATDNYYATIRTAEAALTDANESFDVNDHLSDWAYDSEFSTANISFNDVISDNDAKDWNERMPANKTGERYVNADARAIGEGEKYRLVSSEFTLSGTGFISAKLGGGTAVMSLLDSDGNELVTTRHSRGGDNPILNDAFVDNGNAGNIMDSGSRFNTMARTYLDASAHLGKKVRVALSDDRTGGNWGLAYFDEVVTKYDSVPTLKVDVIQQQWNDSPLYRGVVTDKYVGSLDTDFGKAYDFVQRYYGLMRNPSNDQNYCSASVYQSSDVQDLLDEYNDLDSDVKALVDAAKDYNFGKRTNDEWRWYLQEPDLSYTVGQTIAYALTLPTSGGEPGSRVIALAETTNATVVISVIFVSVMIVSVLYFVRRKNKIHE